MAGSTGQPTMCWFPFVGEKTLTGTWQRANDSSSLAMGYFAQSGIAINNAFFVDVWMDKVAWKFPVVHWKDSNAGIAHLSLDGGTTDLGTIDAYNAAMTRNNFNESITTTVTTAGIQTIGAKMKTKNASASDYQFEFQSFGAIATSQTGASTPAGTDTPGYTWELPGCWMGSKANTNWSTLQQASSKLSGGCVNTSGAQNDEISWDIWQDTGTFKFSLIHTADNDRGVYSIQLDAVEKGTIDGYAAATADNTYSEVTGIAAAAAGVKTFKMKMATKNASSASYVGRAISVKWIRTGS